MQGSEWTKFKREQSTRLRTEADDARDSRDADLLRLLAKHIEDSVAIPRDLQEAYAKYLRKQYEQDKYGKLGGEE